jgi:hypothetical protein
MSGEIIQFRKGRPAITGKSKRQVLAWVPEYRLKFVDGVGIPYWTGFEELCRLVKNSAYTGDYKSYPYEIPYKYESVGEPSRPIKRVAPPPTCNVDQFSWDEFEKKAVWG